MTNNTLPQSPVSVAELNARYENGWYFCWLIERRDRSQPEWFGGDCYWHKNANDAQWYARKSDAEALAGEMIGIDVIVCEHGFAIDSARSS